MKLLDIDLIVRGRYTAEHDALPDGLVHQARLSGITESLMVITISPEHYEIVGSPRSWYLAQTIQAHQVPTILLDHLDVKEIEAISRPPETQKGPIELAQKISDLLPEYKSMAALGRAHNMPRALVCNLVRIHAMPDDIKDRISANSEKVSLGHAKVIAGLDHPQQNQLLSEVIINGLSVHATEERARQMKSAATEPYKKPPEVIHLEQAISELIGCVTTIDMEEGRVVIDYQRDNDILDGVLEHLGYRGE